MIISHLLGGLGNQMFQYAAGRALSSRVSEELRLDTSDFLSYGLHQGYELKRIFGIQSPIATKHDLQKMLGWRSNVFAKKVLKRKLFVPMRGNQLIFEPHFHFWDGLARVRSDAYLYGYWQSEKYFQSAQDLIRKDFVFQRPLDSRNQELRKQMDGSSAISLHIRRGDYISSTANQKVFHALPVAYYRDAIKLLADKVTNPHFYIFSDDMEWVKNQLPIDYPKTYVDHNRGNDSYLDMQLMSYCQHHIIANSSFSWWGAWLNPSPKKIVLAPVKWFSNHFQCADLVPEQWLRI
ncbi:alpha-1,2-fucosyltransferase [Polynucleobacter paneuropaeus]|jgi:hypothetical protein|nr:alpha-1,2-fucosyltransferase [Polynucleobacter paneuropaeus]